MDEEANLPAAETADPDVCAVDETGERTEDEDEEAEEDEVTGSVQLGFVVSSPTNNVFCSADWSSWDGGRVGGRPVWLDPEHLPPPSLLLCPTCSEPMTFLLQIYCPFDHIPSAFHRMLYLFCCRKRGCVSADRAGIKCFRAQLPRLNDYLPFKASGPSTSWIHRQPHWPRLCELCGCRADSACAQCKAVFYCSKKHQRIAWPVHKRYCKAEDKRALTCQDSASISRELYPEYEIEVDEEHLEDDADLLQSANTAKVWEDAEGQTGEDEDAKLNQQDYNRALSEQQYDPIYVQFLTRVSRGGNEQVLRYLTSSWHRDVTAWEASLPPTPESAQRGRLCISSAIKKSVLSIPSCARCGGPRAFEFQLMPQLLHFLCVDKDTKVTIAAATGEDAEQQTPRRELANQKEQDISWGTVDVYTCLRSCQVQGYQEEFVFMQPAP